MNIVYVDSNVGYPQVKFDSLDPENTYISTLEGSISLTHLSGDLIIPRIFLMALGAVPGDRVFIRPCFGIASLPVEDDEAVLEITLANEETGGPYYIHKVEDDGTVIINNWTLKEHLNYEYPVYGLELYTEGEEDAIYVKGASSAS